MPTVVFGGTFDPPHYGHLLLADCARHELHATRLLWLPAGDPYRKRPGATGVTPRDAAPSSSMHRLAMTRLAVARNHAFAVDDREVRRDGPSFSVDTMDELLADGHHDLVFLFGSDAIIDMANWKEPERLIAAARIAIVEKDPGWRARADPSLLALLGPRLHVITTMPRLPISSTLIRARVRDGLPIRYLVPGAVAGYIAERRLYRPL